MITFVPEHLFFIFDMGGLTPKILIRSAIQLT